MAVRSKSPRRFQERAGLIPTVRGPLPTLNIGANLALRLTLKRPLPPAEFLESTQGDPPPDRGLSSPWPHGEVV